MSDIFEKVSKNKVRFPTNKGNVSVEDLWTMPLTSKSGFDLDSVAKAVYANIRSKEEESFVNTTNASTTDRLRLEVVKYIIADKQAENEKRRNAAAAKQRASAIANAIAAKEEESLTRMSLEDLKKAYAETLAGAE